MISVIIAAAGLGTRMLTETMEVSKPLIYYKTKPIIVHLIDQFKTFSDDIVIAISNDEKGKFLQAYLTDYYSKPTWIKFYQQINQTGTNVLVNDCLKLTKHNKTLISWADFIINENIENYLKDNDIFFTANIDCRFSYDGKIIKKSNNPGFCGIYYLTSKPKINLSHEDFLENYLGEIKSTQNLLLTNIGTVAELVNNNGFIKKSNRYFNDVKFIDNEVIKIALNKQGIELQKKEVNWYQNIPSELVAHIPNFIYDEFNNILHLERINGKCVSDLSPDRNFWRKQLPNLLQKLHQNHIKSNEKDIIDNYINKPKQRLEQVRNSIAAWFGENEQLEFEIPQLSSLIPPTFTFIHGDINFNNLMMDYNGTLKLIDPRGYFGQTLLYGDPAYDIAKILYAVDNYQSINEGNYLLAKTNNQTFLIEDKRPIITPDIQYFITWAMETYSITKEKLNFLIFSIWASLPGYIIDQPLGIIASYYKAKQRAINPLIQ